MNYAVAYACPLMVHHSCAIHAIIVCSLRCLFIHFVCMFLLRILHTHHLPQIFFRISIVLPLCFSSFSRRTCFCPLPQKCYCSSVHLFVVIIVVITVVVAATATATAAAAVAVIYYYCSCYHPIVLQFQSTENFNLPPFSVLILL